MIRIFLIFKSCSIWLILQVFLVELLEVCLAGFVEVLPHKLHSSRAEFSLIQIHRLALRA